ncbi:MAG: PocR ligand-binding domain-containing protein [Clostridia bacterium]
MPNHLNLLRLTELLEMMHEVSGMRLSLHDLDGTELYSAKSRSAFCDLICESESGYQRCLTCDIRAITSFAQLARPIQYRCHAGLVDTAVPVVLDGKIAYVILFGQVLDDTPVEKQWQAVTKKCGWYPDMAVLREAFERLPRMTSKHIQACIKVLDACVGNMRVGGFTESGTQDDAQRLKLYVSANYSSPLSLDDVARSLSMSKSKLCQLAASIEPGMTVTKLIAQRRIDMARHLLLNSSAPVRDIAGRVGIADYNYFTKVFKQVVGVTPTAYRKAARPAP